MSITGYADPNRYPQAVIRPDGPEIGQLLALTAGREIVVLAGMIEANPAGKPFITQVVAHQGKLLGLYRKVTVKDEEAEWFSSGLAVPVFQSEGLTYGLAICADIDNSTLFADLARQGAQIVFELAAPGLYGDQAARDWQAGFEWWRKKCMKQLGAYAREHGIWVAVATQAGRTVDEDFPGGGYVFAPGGHRMFETQDWLPGAEYLQIDLQRHQVREIG
jgi:predicted amidohydrolase